MRVAIAAIAIMLAAGTSLVAITAVFAQGQATVAITASANEKAVDWAVRVAGGTSSAPRITLAPTAVGLEGDFTVSIPGSTAKLTLTTAADRKLASVGCLDDLTPPTEISPVIKGSTFTLDVVTGGRYSCFVTSVPADVAPPVAAAPAVQAPSQHTLPRSDAVARTASTSAPGWVSVVVALVVIGGATLVLRPARSRLRP